MTFDEIVDDVAERLNLTAPEALARIGRRVNRRYRRVCVRIGLVSFRRFSSSVSVTPATRDQTFNGEKVLSIKVAGATLPLDSISYATMQELIPTTGDPTCWALKRAGATSQVIQFDSTMDDGLDLTVEVEEAGSTLAGSNVPAFPESWHDILVFGALADELRKKEKVALARDAEVEYERMLGELAYHVAVNGYADFFQGSKESTNPRSTTGGSSGGSGTVTHTAGALTADELVVGNGGADVKSLGAAGTTVQVLHGNAAGVPAFGPVVEADITLADVTAKDVTSTKHGFAPKSPADATKFLNGAATPAFAQVKDSDLATTDVTTNNVTTAKHGFAPKLPNDATKYLDGTGAYSVPPVPAAGVSPTYTAKTANYNAVANDFISCTSGTFTVTLPAAASNANKVIWVVNNGTGIITVGRTGADTIGLATSQSLGVATASSQGDSMCFVSDGISNWNIV